MVIFTLLHVDSAATMMIIQAPKGEQAKLLLSMQPSSRKLTFARLSDKDQKHIFSLMSPDDHASFVKMIADDMRSAGSTEQKDQGAASETDDAATSHGVLFDVTLCDKTTGDFDKDARESFIATVSSSLGVSKGDVSISGIAAGSVVVAMRVKTVDRASAEALVSTVSDASPLSAALGDAGFGTCTISKPTLSGPDASSDALDTPKKAGETGGVQPPEIDVAETSTVTGSSSPVAVITAMAEVSRQSGQFEESARSDRTMNATGNRTFKAGDAIEALYGQGDEWFTGTIAIVNDDGSYAVAYDDGDEEGDVAEDLIRFQVDDEDREEGAGSPLSGGTDADEEVGGAGAVASVQFNGNVPEASLSFRAGSGSESDAESLQPQEHEIDGEKELEENDASMTEVPIAVLSDEEHSVVSELPSEGDARPLAATKDVAEGMSSEEEEEVAAKMPDGIVRQELSPQLETEDIRAAPEVPIMESAAVFAQGILNVKSVDVEGDEKDQGSSPTVPGTVLASKPPSRGAAAVTEMSSEEQESSPPLQSAVAAVLVQMSSEEEEEEVAAAHAAKLNAAPASAGEEAKKHDKSLDFDISESDPHLDGISSLPADRAAGPVSPIGPGTEIPQMQSVGSENFDDDDFDDNGTSKLRAGNEESAGALGSFSVIQQEPRSMLSEVTSGDIDMSSMAHDDPSILPVDAKMSDPPPAADQTQELAISTILELKDEESRGSVAHLSPGEPGGQADQAGHRATEELSVLTAPDASERDDFEVEDLASTVLPESGAALDGDSAKETAATVTVAGATAAAEKDPQSTPAAALDDDAGGQAVGPDDATDGSCGPSVDPSACPSAESGAHSDMLGGLDELPTEVLDELPTEVLDELPTEVLDEVPLLGDYVAYVELTFPELSLEALGGSGKEVLRVALEAALGSQVRVAALHTVITCPPPLSYASSVKMLAPHSGRCSPAATDAPRTLLFAACQGTGRAPGLAPRRQRRG